MALLLIIVIGLIIWSLRLMQGAVKLRDASLILASFLVAISAGGVIVVYMLMDGCMNYLSTTRSFPLAEEMPMVSEVFYAPESTLSTSLINNPPQMN